MNARKVHLRKDADRVRDIRGFGCAPPFRAAEAEETKTFPLKSPSSGTPRYFLPTPRMVLNVPHDALRPMYIQPPAVIICP
ncbi:MAG: hypothetical protein R2912_08915 [Eubacteriales bacterium]